MHGDMVSKSDLRRSSWRWIAALTCLGIVVALCSIAACFQIKDTNQLRNAARKIQIGDSVKTVYATLGSARYGYETGWPSAGAPPTVYGDTYGGRLNYLREDFASFVRKMIRRPEIDFSQGFRSWPVTIQYDKDKRVSAVFIDCIKIK